jgi:hypothetical protein
VGDVGNAESDAARMPQVSIGRCSVHAGTGMMSRSCWVLGPLDAMPPVGTTHADSRLICAINEATAANPCVRALTDAVEIRMTRRSVRA